jgi:hypothetical protein
MVKRFATARYQSSRSDELARHILLLGLEVVEKDGALLGLLTPVTDHDARAVDDLASISFTIKLA